MLSPQPGYKRNSSEACLEGRPHSKNQRTADMNNILNACQLQWFIILSLFDGIGSVFLALQKMGIKIFRAWAWEADTECIKVCKHHFPFVNHVGDFKNTTAAEIAALISKALSDFSRKFPDLSAPQVLWAGGPPCWDYTRIKGAAALGKAGAEGPKFELMCLLLQGVETII